MDLKFELKPEDVQEAMQQAILIALKPEERDRLIQTAVTKLLQSHWQSGSDIGRVFMVAADSVAREIAKAEFEKPENIAKLKEVVVLAFERLFNDDAKSKAVEKIADGISTALFGRGY